MIVDGSLVDPGLGDDIPHAGAVETFLREEMDGGLDDGFTGVVRRTGHRFAIQTIV
jgi:hypothetical protein